MKAELMYRERKYFTDGAFYEIKIWRVPEDVDKPNGLKYAFTYIEDGQRIIGYDNHEFKGDHRHINGNEQPYKFKSIERLWKDFMNDIKRFREGKK